MMENNIEYLLMNLLENIIGSVVFPLYFAYNYSNEKEMRCL